MALVEQLGLQLVEAAEFTLPLRGLRHRPSQWQREFSRFDKLQAELLEKRHANETVAAK